MITESDVKSLVETVYLFRTPANGSRLLDGIEESKTGKLNLKLLVRFSRSWRLTKKKKKDESDEIKPVVVNRSPGFSSKFKKDLAWWFKQDFEVASKVLDLVTAVMENPFEGIGKPEPLKYMDGNIWSKGINLEHRLVSQLGKIQINFLACRYHHE